MRRSSRNILQIVEIIIVSVAAVLYVLYWRPMPFTVVIGAVVCVVMSSLPLWVKQFREKERYAPLLQCAGFGLLLIVSLQGGKSSSPLAIGFGILFLRSAFRTYETLSENSA